LVGEVRLIALAEVVPADADHGADRSGLLDLDALGGVVGRERLLSFAVELHSHELVARQGLALGEGPVAVSVQPEGTGEARLVAVELSAQGAGVHAQDVAAPGVLEGRGCLGSGHFGSVLQRVDRGLLGGDTRHEAQEQPLDAPIQPAGTDLDLDGYFGAVGPEEPDVVRVSQLAAGEGHAGAHREALDRRGVGVLNSECQPFPLRGAGDGAGLGEGQTPRLTLHDRPVGLRCEDAEVVRLSGLQVREIDTVVGNGLVFDCCGLLRPVGPVLDGTRARPGGDPGHAGLLGPVALHEAGLQLRELELAAADRRLLGEQEDVLGDVAPPAAHLELELLTACELHRLREEVHALAPVVLPCDEAPQALALHR